MKILVTGSAGHLGEALMRTFAASHQDAVGLDLKPSAFTQQVGSIADRGFVAAALQGIDAVLHTATLHKPHIVSHRRQDFIDTNVTGTLTLLEEAAAAKVAAFVYTSTTSVFGHALIPPEGQPAAWITEQVVPVPKNIYGITKLAAEHLCELVHRSSAMPCLILRTSRFFPEDDDDRDARSDYAADNLKVNELLYRRADLQDVVGAHVQALHRARAIRFGRYIISATSPFRNEDRVDLRRDAPEVLARHFPGYLAQYRRRGWSMLPRIDRVYVNDLARRDLQWQPRYNFGHALQCLKADTDYRSELAREVGFKGYHDTVPGEGPYPT